MNDNVMTLGIFAHANAGKTTITENLLYKTGVIQEVGRVDTGNTVTDFLSVERERGISVKAALVGFNLPSKKIQLIDTPGHVDFSAEVERSISALDAAVLVVSGADGIGAQTYPIWRALRKKNIPIILFVNKMDREGANYEKLIKHMQEELDSAIVPLIDIKKDGDELAFLELDASRMLEQLSSFDDEFLEIYLEYENNKEKYSAAWLDEKIKKAIGNTNIFPVIGGSALHGIGIDRLLSYIDRYLPPFERKENAPFAALVYSVRVGKSEDLYTKILTGRIKKREEVDVGIGEEEPQKVKNIKMVNGAEITSINEAKSGDIVILNGFSVPPGTIIGSPDTHLETIKFVHPLLNMSVKNLKGPTQELLAALRILEKEDPYLRVQHGGKAGEILINLMGEVQAQVIEYMLAERFKLQTEIVNPTIICKETPTQKGVGRCSYTRVSGVELEVEPLPEGSGFIFESAVETGTLHKKYQRQAEKLIQQYRHQGLYGWELSDMKVTLTDGRFDSMGSETLDFNISVPLAFFRALKNAAIKILDPVCNYTIKIEEKEIKPVALRLNARKSHFTLRNGINSEIYLFGQAHLQDLLNFPLELKKITSGRGECIYELASYQPSHDQNQSMHFIGKDPRNETFFVINEMGGSLAPLDAPFTKRKNSGAKFAWQQMKKELKR